MAAVVWLEEVGKDDVSVVGGKGASLGEMINVCTPVPEGFGVAAEAYSDFINRSEIATNISDERADVNNSATSNGSILSDLVAVSGSDQMGKTYTADWNLTDTAQTILELNADHSEEAGQSDQEDDGEGDVDPP